MTEIFTREHADYWKRVVEPQMRGELPRIAIDRRVADLNQVASRSDPFASATSAVAYLSGRGQNAEAPLPQPRGGLLSGVSPLVLIGGAVAAFALFA